jgi:hypothetical protein
MVRLSKVAGPDITLTGHPEIRQSRLNAWKVVKERTHKLIRVYVFDADANDLLVIGSAVQGFANENTVAGEWVARICLERSATGAIMLKSHQVWAVSYTVHGIQVHG